MEHNNYKHTALNGSQLALTTTFFKNILSGNSPEYFPELVGKKGALFSNITLTKFIEEEVSHDAFDLSIEEHRSIRTFSSGEQKKALLKHLLKSNPDFLIVDNPFDALDVESVANLKEQLTKLSDEMPIIQVFKRRDDLLPFISYAMYIENNKVIFNDTIEAFITMFETGDPFKLNGNIPAPIEEYQIDSNELVKFENVNVSYDNRKIITDINWIIKRGEFWQLKGPNGSGKTTMLTMINGDNPKAFGESIYLFGRKKGTGENVWQIKKQIGYFTPSMMELFKGRHSALSMIVSGLVDSIGLYKKASELQLHKAEEWLKLIGLDEKKNRVFIDLSQVERRLILIARAMIKHPPLLILDEPSTGLDDYSTSMLSVLINKMAKESSTAILYVSHRTEPDLKPEKIFQLTPGEDGSVGSVL